MNYNLVLFKKFKTNAKGEYYKVTCSCNLKKKKKKKRKKTGKKKKKKPLAINVDGVLHKYKHQNKSTHGTFQKTTTVAL